MNIAQLQETPIEDLPAICIHYNVGLSLLPGGKIGGLVPLVEVRRK